MGHIKELFLIEPEGLMHFYSTANQPGMPRYLFSDQVRFFGTRGHLKKKKIVRKVPWTDEKV